MVHLNYKRFGQMRSCSLVDVTDTAKQESVCLNYNPSNIPCAKWSSFITNGRLLCCVMVWVKKEFTQTFNGLSHGKMVQCKVEWFNRETNDLRHTQIVHCKVERLNRETNGLRHTQIVQCKVEHDDWIERQMV